jgi:hypothetical protein
MVEPEPEPEVAPEVEEEEIPEFEPDILEGSAAVAALLMKASSPSPARAPVGEPTEHSGMEHEVAKPYDFVEPVEDQGEEHPVRKPKPEEPE